MRSELSDLPESLAARQFFADRLEAHFRAHQSVEISILILMEIGGPSWRSRIACDLRKKRAMNIVWNRSNLKSAYTYIPAASQPSPDRWTIPGSPFADRPFELT